MMGVSEENKVIARSILQVFGGKPSVTKYWDDHRESNMDILSTINQPSEGLTSYSTIGLSDYAIGYTAEEKPLGIELVGAHATEYDGFSNILATCAFVVINSERLIAPGEIFQDIVPLYYPDSEMKHMLFVDPYLWENLKSVDLQMKKVLWLLAVPISHQEYLYASDCGIDALENVFEQEDIDIFDIERKSTL